MDMNSLNLHAKCDGNTKGNVKDESDRKINLTCSRENIVRSSKKILKENKDENTKKRTKTVIANTTCPLYPEVTKKVQTKNNKLWKKQNI